MPRPLSEPSQYCVVGGSHGVSTVCPGCGSLPMLIMVVFSSCSLGCRQGLNGGHQQGRRLCFLQREGLSWGPGLTLSPPLLTATHSDSHAHTPMCTQLMVRPPSRPHTPARPSYPLPSHPDTCMTHTLSCQSVLAWEAGLGPGIAQVRARSGRVRVARTQMKVSWSDFIDCQELCDFLVPSDSWEASFVLSSRWRGSVPSG